MHLIKKFGVALTAAVMAGVIVGAVSRALMRLATLAVGGEPAFSWSGTFFILLIFAVSMMPGALVAAFTARWWRWIPGAAGAAFLCLPAVGVASEELGNNALWSPLQWVGGVVTSIAVFLTIAAVPIVTVRLIDAMLARVRAGRVQPVLAS